MQLEKFKYKTEFHAHTKPASLCSEVTPEELIKFYKKAGYDSIILSNHLHTGMPEYGNKQKAIDIYKKDYYDAAEAGRKNNINVIFGCEIRFSEENDNDYLLFGIDPEFIDEAYDFLKGDFESFSKFFRNEHRLIIQAHPFRNGVTRADLSLIDGIEAFNMHPTHNSRIGLAAQYAAQNNLIVTSGTDFHNPGWEALTSILTEHRLENSHDAAAILKNRNYLIAFGNSPLLPYGI